MDKKRKKKSVQEDEPANESMTTPLASQPKSIDRSQKSERSHKSEKSSKKEKLSRKSTDKKKRSKKKKGPAPTEFENQSIENYLDNYTSGESDPEGLFEVLFTSLPSKD